MIHSWARLFENQFALTQDSLSGISAFSERFIKEVVNLLLVHGCR